MGALSHAQAFNVIVWVALYYVWIIISVILMINLLIAMLTNTFDMAFDEATLKSRMAFAIGVMKLEKTAVSLRMKTAVGEPNNGKMVITFRSVQRHTSREGEEEEELELGADEGRSDPFAPPKASETSRLMTFVQKRFEMLDAKIEAFSQAPHDGTKRTK